MPLVLARHPVPSVHRRSRARLPSLDLVEAVTPVTVPEAPPGTLGPFPEPYRVRAFDAGSTRIDLTEVFSQGPGGLWAVVWADSGADTRHYGKRPPVRPATVSEAMELIDGSAYLLRPGSTWLRLSPFCPKRTRDATKTPPPEPEAARLADVQARFSRWVEANLMFHQGRLHVRVGVPAIRENGLADIVHPAGFPLEQDKFEHDPAQHACFAFPARAAHRHREMRAKGGEPVRAYVEDRLAEFATLIEVPQPDFATCQAAIGHFVNSASLMVFEIGGRTGGRRASAEAPALRERTEAALAELAPWAALGDLGLIEPHEWVAVIALLSDAARLLMRSYPWSKDAAELEAILSYASFVALPEIGGEEPDLDALSDLAKGAAPPPTSAEETPIYDVSEVRGAFVFDATESRLGRIDRLYVGSDGRVGNAVVRVNQREVAVPFTAFRFGYGGWNDTELRLLMERPALEEWIAKRLPVPPDRRKRF